MTNTFARLSIAALLGTLLALFGHPSSPRSQETPHSECDHWAAGEAFPWVTVNGALNCIDEATQGGDGTALTIFDTDANKTITSAQVAAAHLLVIGGAGTLTVERDLDFPDGLEFTKLVQNSTTGGQSIRLIQNAGDTVTVGNGDIVLAHGDGTDIRGVLIDLKSVTTQNTIDDANDLGLFWDASANALRKTTLDNWPGTGGGGGSVSALTGGLIPIETKALTGSAVSFFFTPEDWSEVVLSISYADMSADDSVILRVSTDGSTFDSTGTSYAWSTEITSNTGTHSPSGDASDSEIELVNGTGGAAADETNSYTITLPDPSAAVEKRLYWIGQITNTAEATYNANGHGAYLASTSAINGLEIGTLGAATFDGGTAILSGRPKTPPHIAAALQTTDATVTDMWTLDLASGETATVVATVNAQLSTGAEIYSAVIVNTCANISGTTSCGTQYRPAGLEIELGSPDAGLDASLVADDTADTIDLDVTGATSETWDWVASLRVVKQ